MTSVTYPNGYVGIYDETIKVGDIVTTYNSGYHIVTCIFERLDMTPVFYYTKRYNDDGTTSKKLKSKCDGVFVRKAEDKLINVIKESQEKIKALEEILKSVNTTNNQI